MTISAYGQLVNGTAKVFKSSGGDAAITLASLANGSARQSAKLDLGSPRGQAYAIECDFELAATPTSGNAINLYAAFSPSATAGTSNPGGVSGTDSAYSGYSSNLSASEAQLTFLGQFTCTAQATTTVQKMMLGPFVPLFRYMCLIVDNESGAAFHTSDANCQIVITPIQPIADDTTL